MCSGPSHPATNDATDAWSARSSGATRTCWLPVVAVISAAVRSPAARLRTARVTSAPAPASARAVSMPIPEAPPVTITRWPFRSIPATTSAAVDSALNGVLMRSVLAVMVSRPCLADAIGGSSRYDQKRRSLHYWPDYKRSILRLANRGEE